MKSKFFITTTVPITLTFFAGQPCLWKREFDVCVISSPGKELESFGEAEGVRTYAVPMEREISLLKDFWSLLRFIVFFLKERPCIVHGNTPKASLLSMLAAWLTCRPVRIYMCHGLRYQTIHGIKRTVLMFMERLTCSCATNVIAVSEGVKQQLISDRLVKEHKTIVVGYGTAGGINTKYFSKEAINGAIDVRSELNIRKEDFVFCFVGRMVGDKGINELVEAFDRLSRIFGNVHLLLVGSVEDRLDPLSNITQILLSTNKRIHAVGHKTDVRPYLAASNAFVLPSYREGVGMVLLEANAMGVPCIATNIIGCRDVVLPSVNGELVEPRNTEDLYGMMKKWVESPELLKEMSDKCREYVCERYSHDVVRDAYYTTYCALAKK